MINHEQESLDRRARRERRLIQFISAVASGAITRKGIPIRQEKEGAAAEIVAFAEEIEKASQELLS